MQTKVITLWALPLVAMLLVIASGCGPTRKRTLVVSTGQSGGTYHPAAESLKKVIKDELPHLTLSLLPSEGSKQSMNRLRAEPEPDNGHSDLAFLQNDTIGHEDVRTILPLFEDVLHFIVRTGSNINGITDLKGKRVAVGPPDSGTKKFVKALFEHYGLSMDSIQAKELPINKACEALDTSERDAVLILAGFKPLAVEALLGTHGSQFRFVSLGNPTEMGDEVDGFLLNYPFASRTVIPQRTYATEGPEAHGLPLKPIVTLAVRTVLACRRDLSEDLVFRLTKAIVEKRSELIHNHPAAAHITDRLDEAALAFPLHPGARRFMHRHEPGFLVTYAEVMAFGLSLMVATLGVLGAIRRWVTMRKKNRIDTYYVRLNDLLADLQTMPPHEKLLSMEKDLSAMQHQAFQELVDEQLVANESFRIFQSLLSDCQQQIYARLNHRPRSDI